MAEDIDQLRTKLRARLEATAKREAELGRDGFFALPKRIQSRLSVLQAEAYPRSDSVEAYLAADHNLERYNEVLDDAFNLVAQIGGMESRLAASRRHRAKRLAIAGALALVLGGGGYAYYQSALADKIAACAEAPACREVGLCGARLASGTALRLECAATEEAHCKSSESCKRVAQCSLVEGACAATEKDCRQSSRCHTDGWCTAVEGRCRAEKDADCRKTRGCIELGACSPVGGLCKVASDADCRISNVCREQQACRAVQNRCVREDWSPGEGGGNVATKK
ncbi:MAG TPA: hypothetical protein ENK57_25955 [Polyangiaceae bacterium]|nr:hypothetical protein [Polyangiaceae bacterium]